MFERGINMKEISIYKDKNGKVRAKYFSRRQIRWFPIKVTEAKRLLQEGKGIKVPKDAY